MRIDAAIKFWSSGATLKETSKIKEKSTETKKDIPPKVGIGVKCTLWAEGWSNNFFASATFITTGVAINAIKNESIAAKTRISILGCSGIKDIIENDKLVINDTNTIMEISTFIAKGQSYEASDGNHDDLMMNLVMFGYFALSEMFQDMTDINLKQMLHNERMRSIEDDLVPFGFIDDGSDAINTIEREDHPWAVDYAHQDF